MPSPTLLVVHTARRRYVVRRDDVFAIRAVEPGEPPVDEPAMVKVELGAMFDPGDRSTRPRLHGLFVPLRRKQIVLMVDQVDLVGQAPPTVELPALLRARLGQPWSTGVLALDEELVVQLDLRAVARSVLLSAPAR